MNFKTPLLFSILLGTILISNVSSYERRRVEEKIEITHGHSADLVMGSDAASSSGYVVQVPEMSHNYSSSRKYGRKMTFPRESGGFCSKLSIPMNSRMLCTNQNTCQVSCLRGYAFPSGDITMTYSCKQKKWFNKKLNSSEIFNCKATCEPTCQNNGECVMPNTCQCPMNYYGPYCQFEKVPCVGYPSTPMGSRKVCNEETCTISCLDGRQFPDESITVNLFCKNGKWIPARAEWTQIPDCVAVCEPSCLNGGNCIDTNLCQCPEEYRGPQCQYLANTCDSSKLNFNGMTKCTENNEKVECELECANGMVPDAPLAHRYICHYTHGVFSPFNIPQCLFPNQVVVSKTISETIDRKIIVKNQPKPGECFVWGSSYIRTFDGKPFRLSSKCTFTLLHDNVNDLFHIQVQFGDNSIRFIRFFINDEEYTLEKNKGLPVLRTINNQLSVPSQLTNMKVELSSGKSVLVTLPAIELYLIWNLKDKIQIEINENLWNRTSGLCGTTSGTDMTGGTITFASRWLVTSLTETCNSPVEEVTKCSIEQDVKINQICENLMNDEMFVRCSSVLPSYMDVCRSMYCDCINKNHSNQNCICDIIPILKRECSSSIPNFSSQWRDIYDCPFKCPLDQVYTSCLPSSQATCISDEIKTINEGRYCREGCICNTGTVLHDGECITKDKCPCQFRGKFYPQGSVAKKDCNHCTCVGGKWSCTEAQCKGQCFVIGTGHYKTFDGLKYKFSGPCSYTLVSTNNITVQIENSLNDAPSSQLIQFSEISHYESTHKRSVTINLPNNTVIKLKHGPIISLNYRDVDKLPILLNGNVIIKQASSFYIQVIIPDLLEIWWDGWNRVHIYANPVLRDNTEGLCGTFNYNQRDDLLTPEGDIEQDVLPFANKWKTKERCYSTLSETNFIIDPCESNIQNKLMAENYCRNITSSLFAECHMVVDPNEYYDSCLYDMCSCDKEGSASCFCPIIAAYAEQCSRQGVIVDWRSSIRHCGVHCHTGENYELCGNTCQRSCEDISRNEVCNKEYCLEGCYCPSGYAYDVKGECVPISDCPCIHNGQEYQPHQVRIMLDNKQACTCKNALWECRDATKEEIVQISINNKNQSTCNSPHMELTQCEPPIPITCNNMHNPPSYSAAVCHVGCICSEGYVLDSLTGKCVLPTECPCHHGGESYYDGYVVQESCNNCTCSNGKWICTKELCPGTCSSWGDTHFRSFDGKFFDFQGTCDYIFAKGQLSEVDSFTVIIEIVPCGSGGTSCAKSVTLKIGSGEFIESVTMIRDKDIPIRVESNRRIAVHEVGLYITVEVAELGIALQWDKGTRIGLQAHPKWKKKLSGLCGNFNGDMLDDFQTPSGGLSEVSAQVFADSWKLQQHCPQSPLLLDPCVLHPQRKFWAVQQCSRLRQSPIFKKCHSEVPVDEYLNRCIFDTCACDQGGDCECLCTVFAAYAQECNARGVNLKWRKQNFCPIQCENGTEYSPCIASCPEKTCDNIHKYESQLCNQLPCVEGCAKKSCAANEVFKNSTSRECVDAKTCNPVCMNINNHVYYEQDIIEADACHTCYCSKGQKICKGVKCTTTEPTTIESVDCVNGWGEWIKINDNIKSKQDIEKITQKCGGNNIEGIKCRMFLPHAGFIPVPCRLNDTMIIHCQDDCSRFEIKVLCNCDITTTTETFEPTKTTVKDKGKVIVEMSKTVVIEKSITIDKSKQCHPGYSYTHKISCKQTCHYFGHHLEKSGECKSLDSLVLGCVKENSNYSTLCSSGKVWRDNDTCVLPDDCTCATSNGTMLKPGRVIVENECIMCQCVNNEYICKNECVRSTVPVPVPELTTVEDITTESILIIPTSASSAIPCTDGSYGSINVKTYKASSTSGEQFNSSNAKFTSETCWRAGENTKNEFINLDLGLIMAIYGVAITGNPIADEYVKSYQILYSSDGISYDFIRQNDNPQIFRGPIFHNSMQKQFFNYPLEVRYIQIKPITWNGWISMKIDLLGCVIQTTTTELFNTATTEYEITTESATENITPSLAPVCYDSMGLDSGLLLPGQVTVSSSHDNFNAQYASLSSDKAWIPFTASSNQWIQFDFLDGRILTGIITKGSSADGAWVEAYKVKYSHDGIFWNSVLDNNRNEKIFEGNIDSSNIHRNYFDTAIKARYLRVYPTKWFKSSALRIEILGCFIPYPMETTTEEEISTTEATTKGEVIPSTTEIATCNICPGVSNPYDCNCEKSQWWNGRECSFRSSCPCVVGIMTYDVGAVYDTTDCNRCTCVLGGTSDCKIRECPDCKPGYQRKLTKTCDCRCEPCETGLRLCSTSNTCINETLWCNGYVDCPDDEIDCKVISQVVTKELILECPPPSCPIGYKVFLKSSSSVSSLSTNKTTKKSKSDWVSSFTVTHKEATFQGKKSSKEISYTYSFTSKKTISDQSSKVSRAEGYFQRQQKQQEQLEQMNCPEWTCEKELGMKECAVPSCPINTQLKTMKSNDQCPSYECVAIERKEKECLVTSRKINTFDGLSYKYEICDHVLAEDNSYSVWKIIKKHRCPYIGSCVTSVIIILLDEEIEIFSNLTALYNGYFFTITQLQNIGSQSKQFAVREVQSKYVIFVSTFNFNVIWSVNGDVRITVDPSLRGMVDGMCGHFDYDKNNDKIMPNGKLAVTTQEFADSWKSDPNATCQAKVCPADVQKKALSMCNVFRTEPLSKCEESGSLNEYIGKCVETICTCADTTLDIESCRCPAIAYLTTECQKLLPDDDVSNWRVVHDCPVSCPSPYIYDDCYNRVCERTCDTLLHKDPCPKMDGACFPGCYCPNGLIKHGDSCIKPSKCRNCECQGSGTTLYTTFDKVDFSLAANCSYVLSRTTEKYNLEKPGFTIIVTQGHCISEMLTGICANTLTVITDTYEVSLSQTSSSHITATVNKQIVNILPFVEEDVSITLSPGRSVTLLMDSIELSLTFMMQNQGFYIRIPSQLYQDKTEGLCGTCNNIPDDDIKTPKGEIPESIDTFITSWRSNYNNDSKEVCGVREEVNTTCKIPPAEENPCLILLDETVFGQCYALVNVQDYVKKCNNILCDGIDGSYCHSFEAYAIECQANGVCLNWRSSNFCPYKCPPGLIHKPCGTECDETCDNYEQLRRTNCASSPSEKCICPVGQVLANGTCMDEFKCHPCDEEGHFVGDKWKPDECTTCICNENKEISCLKKECPPTSSLCQLGYKSIIGETNDNPCCTTFICVPDTSPGLNCSEPIMPICGKDQVVKVETTSDGCEHYICQCISRDECNVVEENDVELLPGMVKVIKDKGCCPTVESICQPETCPTPKECPEHYERTEVKGPACCPEHICQIPDDTCIYEYEWIAASKGGERKRLSSEAYSEAKVENSVWFDGPCRQCICKQQQAVCSVIKCANQHESDHFVTEPVYQYDECCPKYKTVACKIRNMTFQPGSIWPSSNPCKNYTCVFNDDTHSLAIQEILQSCDTECPLGSVYMPPKNSKDCCGYCEQQMCVHGASKMYLPGSNWTSSDNCTTFQCTRSSDGVLQISGFAESCPSLIDCPPDRIYQTACCEMCNKTEPLSHHMCFPESLALNETIKLIETIHTSHGKCTNLEAIHGFTECRGTCDSFTFYSTLAGKYDSKCNCCQPAHFEELKIDLTCSDGYMYKSSLKVPSSCSCLACGADLPIK